MRLPENKKLHWNYVGLAFALPTTLMLVVMFICSVEPFGSNTMLYSDQFHQYFPFFVEFRETLRAGESLLWNWSVGLGMDYLGLISYYLASPLNLLSVLVPDAWVISYFSLLMPIKLGLASGFFALMLKKCYQQDDLALTLFGSFYGLCAWALGYQWNVMWLDTFALLPLVVLGTVLLLRDKQCILYTVSLFLSIFANYYVGLFVCIFVFLFFFCYEICRFKSLWRTISDLVRIGFFTVLAIGMTAILELPTLAALQDTYSSINSFPEGFSVNMISGEAVELAKEAWDAFKTAKESGEADLALWWTAIKLSWPPLMEGMAKVAGQMGGGLLLTYVDGLPNLYCGVLPVALGFLFLLARNVKLRDKLCCVGLLVLFMLSFILRQLDYIWHGFHFTNQIPYRFSFLFSFVLLYMAYRAWLERERFRLWQILLAAAMSAGIFLSNKDNYGNAIYLVLNFALLGLYLLAMCYGNPNLLPKKESAEQAEMEETAEDPLSEETVHWQLPQPNVRRRQGALLVAVLLVVEMVIHVVNFTANFSIYDYDYPKGEKYANSMFSYLREREKVLDFFRTEVTHAQTLNDGALNGYNGISTFTSSANVRTTEFMEALGYASRDNWNRYCWEESSPV
ncbi:MAG: YfhO family protein, partial [Oscillospiraceae bacterium]|nr:YfhO family protein [Oscillospiraceae bacterium]